MRNIIHKILLSKISVCMLLVAGSFVLVQLIPLSYTLASKDSVEFKKMYREMRDKRDRIVKMSLEEYEKECRKEWEKVFELILKSNSREQLVDSYRETMRDNFLKEYNQKWDKIRKAGAEPSKEEVLSDYKKSLMEFENKMKGIPEKTLFQELKKHQWNEYFKRKLEMKKGAEISFRIEEITKKPWISMKGKVVDQNGKPVERAKLTFRNGSGMRTGFFDENTHKSLDLKVVTDEEGMFEFEGIPGDFFILVNMECPSCRRIKEGHSGKLYIPYIDNYYREIYQDNYPDNGGFNSRKRGNGEYHIATGGAEDMYYYDMDKHEVIFELYREEFREQPKLFEIYETHINVFHDKPPAVYNVFMDNKLIYPDPNTALDELNGDLLLETGYNSDNKRDVFLKLTSIGGGIVETEYSDIPFNAPQEGYQKSYVMNLIERKGGGNLRKKIFVRSRNGKVYMKLTLSVNTSKYKGREYVQLTVTGLVNPMGSRNLEPWGERYKDNYIEAFAKHDWSRDDFDDIADKLAEKQAGQIKKIGDAAICQMELGKKYWLGYLGDDGVFYRFKGSGSDEKHESVKLVAAEKLVEFERPKTVSYCLNKDIYEYNYKMCSVLKEQRVVLIYPVIVKSDERCRGADHLRIPDAWLSKLKKENYRLVNVQLTNK